MRERSSLAILAVTALFTFLSVLSSHARADLENLTEGYTYKLMPSAGLQIVSTQLGGAQVVPGPTFGLKYLVESGGFFFFPAIDLSFLFGMDQSPNTLYSVGLNAGGWIDPKALGLWLGLGYENFVGYRTSGSAAFRGGIFLPSGDQNMWVVEGNWTTLPVVNGSTTTSYSFIGASVSYSFLFPVFNSGSEDGESHHSDSPF
jgi:hypothetical protein